MSFLRELVCLKSVCHHEHLEKVNQNTKECVPCFLYVSFLYIFSPYILPFPPQICAMKYKSFSVAWHPLWKMSRHHLWDVAFGTHYLSTLPSIATFLKKISLSPLLSLQPLQWYIESWNEVLRPKLWYHNWWAKKNQNKSKDKGHILYIFAFHDHHIFSGRFAFTRHKHNFTSNWRLHLFICHLLNS